VWVCGGPERVQFGQFVFVAGLVLWGFKGQILAGVDALPQRRFEAAKIRGKIWFWRA